MDDTQTLSPAEFEAQCLCLNTQRAARALARRYDSALRPVGLTSGQFAILAALDQAEPLTLGRIAGLLGLERTTLTRNLAPLERQRLVRSRPDPGDQRVRGVTLTAAGAARRAAAFPLWKSAQAASKAALTTASWDDARAMLTSLANE